jgi:hypothetical protein
VKWGSAALWLLGIGATLGPCYDAFHTFSGTTWYGAPQFLRTVWWCPPLFAFAALSFGLSRPGFDVVVRRAAVTAPAGREVAIAMGLFTFGYAASGFLPTQWPVKLVLLVALFAFCLWSFDRTWAGVLGAVSAAFSGWLVEYFLTSHGLFVHRDQQLLGVAGWIPGLYALASVALGTLGRWLVAR